MAVEKLDKEESDGEKGEQKGGKKKSSLMKKLLILGGVLVLIGGGAGAAFFFLGNGHGGEKGKGHDKAKAEQPKAPPVYYAFDPAFVVNFKDESEVRFLQVTVEVMARDPLVIESVKTHTPVIRNNLIMLLSNQTVESISTVEGKEKVRAETLKEIQKILKKQTGSPGVEDVYFTGFVMQ